MRNCYHGLQCALFAKAKVESGVQLVERWIIAALRHHQFFTLTDVNGEIRRLLEKINAKPFRKRQGSRFSLFEAIDRPALRPPARLDSPLPRKGIF